MLKKEEENIGELVKKARKEKKISARKLASLIGISHTEINNIESGIRYKPSILILKGFEKYLDIPFRTTAKLAGYSKETIKFGDDQTIVSYEMYDKKLNEFKQEKREMEYIIEYKRYNAMDIKQYFKEIHDYLKKQNNINKKLLDNANTIERLIENIEREYKSPFNEK